MNVHKPALTPEKKPIKNGVAQQSPKLEQRRLVDERNNTIQLSQWSGQQQHQFIEGGKLVNRNLNIFWNVPDHGGASNQFLNNRATDGQFHQERTFSGIISQIVQDDSIDEHTVLDQKYEEDHRVTGDYNKSRILTNKTLNNGQTSPLKAKISEEIDDLINEITTSRQDKERENKHKNPFRPAISVKSGPPKSQVTTKSKVKVCYPVFIGGSNLPEGQTESSLAPKCCDRLICLDCGQNIIRFQDSCWKSNVTAELFSQKKQLNSMDLIMGLEYARGICAFACKCKWKSVFEMNSRDPDQLHWVCSGDHL